MIRYILISIGLFLVFLVAPATAASLRATPALELSETWNSNVLETSSNEMSDFVFRANPRLGLAVETAYGAFGINGGFESETYSKHTELDKTVATKNVDLLVTEPLRFSPRFSVLPAFRYVESVDSIRRNELTQLPIAGLPPSESIVTTRSSVRDIAASLRAIYLLSPNIDFGIGGGWVKRQYLDNAAGLFNPTTWNGNVSVSYGFTPRVSSGVFFSASDTSYNERPSAKTYTGGLTGTFRVSEQYTIEAQAGATYLRQVSIADNQTLNQWSPYGHFSVSYSEKEFSASFFGSYEATGDSSSGAASDRGNVTLSVSKQFLPLWSWSLSATYQTNRSAAGTVMIENADIGSGTAGIAYRAAEWATLRLVGNLSKQWSNSTVGGDVKRESIFFGVDVGKTYILF